MFSLSSLRFNVPNLFRGSTGNGVDIPSVAIHDVETTTERRGRTLKHLLKANHTNHSILYHNLQFHNHAPHILGSAYLLGATTEQLNKIYDEEAEELEPWHDAPGEVSEHDWREYLGKKEYQRAFIDFFEDRLVNYGYDWKRLLHDYLLEGKEPLINGVIGGLGHPLIHLGYGFELSSSTVAIEGLAMTACAYNYLHKYMDDPKYTRPSSYTAEPLDILQKIQEDSRFNNLNVNHEEDVDADDVSALFDSHEEALLEHWNAWQITNPTEQFRLSQEAAVALFVSTQPEGAGKYDFFLVHVLTTSHAVRILLPLIPSKFHVPLVRQWWLFAITVYVRQLRPDVKLGRINDYELKGRNWDFVRKQALESTHATDAHFVKALRAMQEASKLWSDNTEYFLKAAVRVGADFEGWGFGP